MKKLSNFSFTTIFVTFFWVGKIPFAPGTFGSLCAFPLYFILTTIGVLVTGGVESVASSNLIMYLLMIITVLFFLGVVFSENYSSLTGRNDPKEVVIDEVVGQLLAIAFTMYLMPSIDRNLAKFIENNFHIGMQYFTLIFSFILFRIFDIKKPWPIGDIDKNVKGGLGIMLDDLVAAFLSVIFYYVIIDLATSILYNFGTKI